MLHYLRIAVTALSLTACVLLLALWVRSYWWHDVLFRLHRIPTLATLRSENGHLYLTTMNIQRAESGPRRSGPAADFEWRTLPHKTEIKIPHWFVVALCAVGVFPMWIKSRFSLRTLLIATTLVAVVLGIVVAAR